MTEGDSDSIVRRVADGAGQDRGRAADSDGLSPRESVVEAALTMWSQGASPDSEIAKHIRPEHIERALDHADSAHQRISDDRKDSRRWKFVAFVVACVFCLSVVALLLFSGNSAILDEHLDAVLGFVAGIAGGYGLGKKDDA